MRSIAFINQKGGVGKTTTAVNVACALRRAGQRVMLVDLDPQAHASLHLGIELGPDDASVYDVLTNARPVAEVARYADEKLTVVPAHIDLVAAEMELADALERERIIGQALAPHHEHHDYCIVDCGPSLGVLTINALAAVDEVMIPVQPHFFALQGLGKLLETVALVHDTLNPRVRVTGIVLCMYESGTKLAQEVAGDILGFVAQADADAPWHGARVFETRVRRNIKLAESPSFGKSIFEYAPESNGAADYAALAQEILRMPTPAAREAADVDSGGVGAESRDGEPLDSREDERAAPRAPEREADPEADEAEALVTEVSGSARFVREIDPQARELAPQYFPRAPEAIDVESPDERL